MAKSSSKNKIESPRSFLLNLEEILDAEYYLSMADRATVANRFLFSILKELRKSIIPRDARMWEHIVGIKETIKKLRLEK